MMVRIFHTGTGSAKAAIGYLMGKNDHTGQARSVPPEWLHGSPSLFQLVCDSTTRMHKYVSGAISFRDSEHPSDEQVRKLIEAFKASFLPGLKECDNYADAWIAHRDKGNLELHFVVAGTEIQTGRQLNIHPPGKRNVAHFQAFTQVMNQAMGYDQVVPDPLKVALNAFEAKSAAGKKPRRIKTLLAKELHRHIVSGQVANRDELITHLEDQYGEVTRVGKDYVSIRLPGSAKPTRLKGPLFQEGADYAELIQQHLKAKQPQKLTEQAYASAKETLERFTAERAAYFAKRFKKKTSFRRVRAHKAKGFNAAGTRSASQTIHTTPISTGHTKRTTGDSLAGMQASTAGAAVQRIVAGLSATESTSAGIKPTGQPAAMEALVSAAPPLDTGSLMPSGSVILLEVQLGNLAKLMSKLMVRARTTRNTQLYEVLHAQIVKLQHQMGLLSVQLEEQKAKDAGMVASNDSGNKPKV